MDKQTVESLERTLLARRGAFLKGFSNAEANLRLIAEDRESELEELAQGQRSARLLSHLDDRSIRAVEEVDAALLRISQGSYGACESCQQAIPIARLQSLPATRFCLNCASKVESRRPGVAETAVHHSAKLPEDLDCLTDRELEGSIREAIHEDGRIDKEELRITCRDGAVYLYGVLPSEVEHSILLELVTDVVGLKDVVDHIRVEEIPWERENRSKKKPPEISVPWVEPPGTEDIVESAEEGKDFVPPSNPPPEEE